jgi:hypothetical protein
MIVVKIDDYSNLLGYYQAHVTKAFPKLELSFNEGETHLALLDEGLIVGGITLEYFKNLQDDESISKYFNVKTNKKALKMKRLWVDCSNSKLGMLKLFEAVLDNVERESFLYGLLSLPLKFALNNNGFLPERLGYLEPKMNLLRANWDSSKSNSSDGQKLLKTYLMFGARPLGEMCACEEDHSVRVVMGMSLKDFNYQTLSSRYA